MQEDSKPTPDDLEREFDVLYHFLLERLPKSFNRAWVNNESFSVGVELDDEPVASFLMTYDQFNMDVPLAIQTFLKGLSFDWIVFGSFGIKTPFNPDGSMNWSPRFSVTRSDLTGEVDMQQLEARLGSELQRAFG
jgi:hypothetical protein